MKRFIAVLSLVVGLFVAGVPAADAQVLTGVSQIDLSGNKGSPVIGVYNQSPYSVIAITCGGSRVNLPNAIPFNGVSQVNFGGWACSNHDTISAITADGKPHTLPWVDIRRVTMITVKW